MAKLTAMPEQAIVDGFKGTIDFYYWRGIPCARKWPHWPPREPTPREKANQDLFGYAAHLYSSLPAVIIEAFREMALGTPYTCRDLFMRSYISGWV